MNTASRKPADSAENVSPPPNGLNHDSDGWTASSPALPVHTRTSATTANTASTNSSSPSRITCVRADSSMPTQAIHVMARIQAQPSAVTAHVLAARSDSPNRSNVYCPAIWARLAITMTSAATMTQPVSQPVCRPNVRATQVKLVPQSGSTSLSAL